MVDYNKVVVFKLGSEEFAADIMQIERILNHVRSSIIPHAPLYVEGVIKYEDRIIPVINLKKRLGLEDSEASEESKIIVTKIKENIIGLSVDYVEQVLSISDENVETPPDLIKGSDNNYIQGIAKVNERIVILLNMEKLFTCEEIIEINSLY